MQLSRFYRFLLIVSTAACLSGSLTAQNEELRGVWLAWAGADIPTKSAIAQVMEELAANNVNTVYVDVWRYGYPYYRSELFHALTGKYTDPALDEGRDVLEDFIAEGHRVGLEVHAWFEHGFVAGQGANDDLYDAKPHWFARDRAGNVLFNGNLQFKWLSHVNREAQQFLIDMVQEVIANYDVDGVELDRIRYPEMDCGYDSATVAVYRQEHGGADPPANVFDPAWIQWRSEKLSQFMAAAYDSFKAVNPLIEVSNAPIVYPYGYSNFCQDWRPWINDGSLDHVSPQVYRATNASYAFELDLQMAYVNDLSKLYPGIASITNSTPVPTGELIAMIETTRNRGLAGHVIWYHATLLDDLPALKAGVYQDAVAVPGRPPGWRRPAIIVNEDDPLYVQRSSGWNLFNTVPGFEDGSLYAAAGSDEWIEYAFDIPEAGWYEVYAYIVRHWNGHPQAPYEITHQGGTRLVELDQALLGNARWQKLGDFYLEAGAHQPVVRLSNQGIGTHLVFADAVMLLNSNQVNLPPVGITPGAREVVPQTAVLYQNYPNPFNPETEFGIRIAEFGFVNVDVYDVAGRRVCTLLNRYLTPGEYRVRWDGNDAQRNPAASGVYIYRLRQGKTALARKMVLMR